MFRVIILSLLASLASACSASDFSRDTGVNHTDAPSMLIILRGEIMPGELDAIKKDIESNLDAPPESYGQRLFVLTSQGGDADEAMRIGRYIRKIKGTTMIPESGRCYSACVFMLAGGVERIIEGPVAINWAYFGHRTNITDPENRNHPLSLTKDFFEEMNIPSSLAEEMYVIPPSEARLLSDSELSFYFSR